MSDRILFSVCGHIIVGMLRGEYSRQVEGRGQRYARFVIREGC